MKIPLKWLKEYVDVTIPVEQLADRLTLAGLEVDFIEYVGLPPAEVHASDHPSGTNVKTRVLWDREKIVVAAITAVMPHPNADRLVLATLDDGITEHTVLTGATNLFTYSGKGPLPSPIKVAYAREGATIYDAHQPGKTTSIKRVNIRGVDSYSMVCSERELGISDEHEGIIIFDSDAPVGMPLADYIGDVVMEIAITANMVRNANVLGVAREVAAITGQKLRSPKYDFIAEGLPIYEQVQVEVQEPELNPRFTAALIKGVTVGSSPYWMQLRLRLAGMRPISNIVDITNYVMLEIGQPLHAFDYDKLVERADGHAPKIITRLATAGEGLKTLDGVERKLAPFTMLVADTKGALSIGGIIGGAESEVGLATKNVLLEAASWEFINVRKTIASQKMQFSDEESHERSEAGYRFSRGIHPAMAERGLKRAIEMMRQISGGVIASGIIDTYLRKPADVIVDLSTDEVARILGFSLTTQQIKNLLESIGCVCELINVESITTGQSSEASSQPSTIRVTIPDHRFDIGTGIVGQADLIEELARLHGYHLIPETQMSDTIPPQRRNLSLLQEERARDTLVNAGLQEVITYRLTTPEREARLLPGHDPESSPPYIKLENPIAADRVVMRRSLLASVLEVAEENFRHQERLALFEIGTIFIPVEGELLPHEPRRLAIVMTGQREPLLWRESRDVKEDQRGAKEDDLRKLMDFYDLKGVVEALAASLHLQALTYKPANHPSYHPARCAQVELPANQETTQLKQNGQIIGWIGELHPLVCKACGFPEQPILVADLDLEQILAAIPERHLVRTISEFPPVKEDLAIIVDDDVLVAEVQAVIEAAGGDLLTGVMLFDIYRGEQIGVRKKSLAFSLTYQAPNRTLKDSEVAEVRNKIVQKLKDVGGMLRG
jgi:phenylalanyl-tRNA synthetase beta chain